jgi:hypothetical protein
VCSNGACVVSCPSPQVACGSSCVDTRFDPENCGRCGNACPSYANGSRACSNGACVPGTCNTGFGNCNNNSTDGCEANLLTSTSNCGTCGTVCATPANAVAGCNSGTCGVGACNANFGNCNNSSTDGCEIDLRSNNTHCGACNRGCTGGQTCQNGACTNAQTCSQRVASICAALGGWVTNDGSQFVSNPTLRRGRLFCLQGSTGAGSDCNQCDTYRMYVWTDGATALCSGGGGSYNTVAGRFYAGHSPCSCNGTNLINCGTWDLAGCTPD